MTPDANGWMLFTGTASAASNLGNDDGKGQIRNIHVTTSIQASDPRVSGEGTIELSVDYSTDSKVGIKYGTAKLTNAGGAWVGTCAGPAWDGGNASDVTCWYAGSGGYAGLTFYVHVRTAGSAGEALGLIYKGSLPAH